MNLSKVFQYTSRSLTVSLLVGFAFMPLILQTSVLTSLLLIPCGLLVLAGIGVKIDGYIKHCAASSQNNNRAQLDPVRKSKTGTIFAVRQTII